MRDSLGRVLSVAALLVLDWSWRLFKISGGKQNLAWSPSLARALFLEDAEIKGKVDP